MEKEIKIKASNGHTIYGKMKDINQLEIVQVPLLSQLASVQHAFFTRYGGVSQNRYASLNCGYATEDSPINVRENRTRVTAFFGYPLASLVTVKNMHGSDVIVVEETWLENQRPEADAMVTKQRGLILGSDSADCPIVLFADEQAGVIGLAHAGWRGAKNGVLESTVHQMTSLGATPRHIIAAISPCIAQASYEVSSDFYAQFTNDNPENIRYFINAQKSNHYQFDLPGFVETRLMSLGIKLIGQTGIDTYEDKRFFSCRRAFHSKEDDFGCHFSCIFLDKQSQNT